MRPETPRSQTLNRRQFKEDAMLNKANLDEAATTGVTKGATYGLIGFLVVGVGVFLYFFSPAFWREAKIWGADYRAKRSARKAAKSAAKEAAASAC